MAIPPSLKDQIEALPPGQAAKTVSLCYKETQQAVAFIEFRPEASKRTGFAASQLLQYTLDTDPPRRGHATGASERLELGFSTADVMVHGVRLAALVELLATHKLAAVEAVATDAEARYANLHPSEPWVSAITIARLDRPSGAQTERTPPLPPGQTVFSWPPGEPVA